MWLIALKLFILSVLVVNNANLIVLVLRIIRLILRSKAVRWILKMTLVLSTDVFKRSARLVIKPLVVMAPGCHGTTAGVRRQTRKRANQSSVINHEFLFQEKNGREHGAAADSIDRAAQEKHPTQSCRQVGVFTSRSGS